MHDRFTLLDVAKYLGAAAVGIPMFTIVAVLAYHETFGSEGGFWDTWLVVNGIGCAWAVLGTLYLFVTSACRGEPQAPEPTP
jgi:hypothetical protein